MAMGNNETTPLRPYSLLDEFMKTSESWINKTILGPKMCAKTPFLKNIMICFFV